MTSFRCVASSKCFLLEELPSISLCECEHVCIHSHGADKINAIPYSSILLIFSGDAVASGISTATQTYRGGMLELELMHCVWMYSASFINLKAAARHVVQMRPISQSSVVSNGL